MAVHLHPMVGGVPLSEIERGALCLAPLGKGVYICLVGIEKYTGGDFDIALVPLGPDFPFGESKPFVRFAKPTDHVLDINRSAYLKLAGDPSAYKAERFGIGDIAFFEHGTYMVAHLKGHPRLVSLLDGTMTVPRDEPVSVVISDWSVGWRLPPREAG